MERRLATNTSGKIPGPCKKLEHLSQGTQIDLVVSDDTIQIKPIRRREPVLDDLLCRVTDENIHEEIDTGSPVGREVW